MKRIFLFLCAAMLTAQAWAQTTFTVGNLKYTVTDETNHYVSVGKGSTYPTGALEIPSQVTYPETDGVTYTVTELAYDAFYGCSGLTSVVIPNTVTVLGQNAFYNCSSLVSANIPDGVTEIRPGTFYNCKKLTSIIIPNSVTIIKSSAFQYCESLISLNIPDAVVTINNSTFYGCKNLATVTLGNSLKVIGDYSFGLCTSLTSLTFPNSIKTIGHDMFDGCTNLTSVNIPNGVTSIGEKTFRNCKSLTTINIPKTVTNISNLAFAGCNAEINIESGNTSFSTEDGVLFNKNKTTLIFCPSGKIGEYNIPNSVKTINGGAFYGCTNLSSISIPTSTTNIGNNAFYNCSGLTSVTIPNSVTSIGSEVFRGCSKLTDINVESDNTNYASENGVLFNKNKTTIVCYPAGKAETEYTIPNSVTSIGTGAFRDCSGLTAIAYEGTSAPFIGTDAFRNVNSSVKVCVPEDYASAKFGGFSVYKGHNKVTDETVPPTCTETGLTEGVHCSNCGRAFVAQEEIPALGHNYGTPAYAWAEDGSTCSATAICQHNASHVATENATITSAVTTAATCEGDGTTNYTATFENELFSTQTKAVVDIPALGHSYGTPAYAWAEDGSTCTATAICQHNASHVATENATITSAVTTAATCEGDGTTTYTATFENEPFSTQTKAIEDIPAHGHNYGTPAYAWAEDGSTCSATAICQHNASHVATENATITSAVTTAATCEGDGTTTYTATFENEPFSTQTKAVVDIPALGHDYGTPAYAWAEDGSTCSATAICQRDESHVATGNATITSAVTTAATCEGKGTTTYTATFENELFSTQTKAVVDILATGHTAAEAVAENYAAPTCTASGAVDSVVYCSVCQAELFREGKEVAALGHTPDSVEFENIVTATCTTVGSKDSVVYCSVCQVEISREEKESPALGHTYSNTVTAPTCTAVGYTTHTCSVCEYTYNSDTVAATGHTEAIDAAVVATCLKTGLSEGKHCSVCEAVIVAQDIIPALGHEFKTYTFDNNATTEADGTETAVCEHGCGATDTRTAAGTKIATTPDKGTTVTETAANAISIYTQKNVIVVENAQDEISVYDAMGRLVGRDAIHRVRAELQVNTAGLYIVKVGTVAKRVMVND